MLARYSVKWYASLMHFVFLASAWHNFWDWFDHLSNPDKIAYWSFLSSLVAGPIIGLIAALVGAKYGAKAAFELGRAQQKQDIAEGQLSALNIAQYTLTQHWNTLAVVNDKLFTDFRKEGGIISVANIYFPEDIEPLPLNPLYFIAEIYPAILRGIEIVDSRYLATFDQFKALQRLVARLLEDKDNQQLLKTVEDSMTSVNIQIERLLPLLDKMVLDVRVFRKERFPNREVPELERYVRKATSPKPPTE